MSFGSTGLLWVKAILMTQRIQRKDFGWLTQGGPGFADRHECLYRTSDLVRYEDDGNLRFIERKNLQIKIRGQRVEI